MDEEEEEEEEEVKKGAPPSIMTTRPHEQQQQHTCHSTTKCPRNFQPKLQDGKRSENLLFFCPVPSHQNQEAILGEYQRGNWNYEFEANFLRPDFYTVVSQIRKSEMGLLRFLFYVAAINEFPAEYLSIIFFETIFRGERTQTWGIILKFK